MWLQGVRREPGRSLLAYLRVLETGGGARERLANEKATFCGLLNTPSFPLGEVRGLRRKFEASEPGRLSAGTKAAQKLRIREHFQGTGRRPLSLLFWER